MNPWKLEDPERADEYWHAAGLGRLAERMEHFRQDTKDVRPADYQNRQAEMLTRSRSAGEIGRDSSKSHRPSQEVHLVNIFRTAGV